MRPADRGHVINIISLAGLVAAPGEALYGASKHAAIAYTLGALRRPPALGLEGRRGERRLSGRDLDADAL